MNRFRTRKKTKDDSTVGRSSSEEQSSLPSFKGFRRGKKSHEEEQKKEVDLTTALPSSDDFRTSLLMTGLSARFSMLREQDDPSTKIGKASDDSVLYPKRQSRLADFAFGRGLADIAEVESIRAAAPFARTGSFASDDADFQQGSIMNRAKPTEGNNLFGGRQKIYKIPIGSSAKTAAGGMGGRALYEDDVALSAFQKWRQAEKAGQGVLEGDGDDGDDRGYLDVESETTRPESPLPLGYNRRRETSSTTSSIPSLARNSTAATSVTSQPPSSLKDWQSQGPLSTSSASTPTLERHVTRTRRLYEQGLNQDLHDQQSSALSRIDTLSRQRPLGSRTPDLAGSSPSPTGNAFSDRFGGDRRHILTKASAPNLRSISPPATGSSIGTMDLGIKPPSWAEARSPPLETPPLSPPTSEAGDHPLLAIGPNDRGKATAMGVFQKPSLPYDESKFAQRQLQLQQGRETPTQRFRAESGASFSTNRSRSSSAQRHRQDNPSRLDTALEEERPYETSFFIDSDEGSTRLSGHPATKIPSDRIPQRPADHEHPALRQSTTSASLPPSRHASTGPASREAPKLEVSIDRASQVLPEDSPTLGPGAGLSGMVRQHLRSESGASSIYGGMPQTAGPESQFPVDARNPQVLDDLGVKSNPWQDQDWYSGEANEDAMPGTAQNRTTTSQITGQQSLTHGRNGGNHLEHDGEEAVEAEEEDEFASQLAHARRRVQERLTSYVESDSSRAPSPLLQSPEPPRNNPLGILRAQSSRGSLKDRPREASQSKAMKMLGIGTSTMTTSPSPSKQSFDDFPVGTMSDSASTIPKRLGREADSDADTDADATSTVSREEENVPPGLRAFRQARRELQKRKELETLARHQNQPHQSSSDAGMGPSVSSRGTSSREPGAPRSGSRPPSAQNRRLRASTEDSTSGASPSMGNASRPSSRSDRDRSGSETSTSIERSRPPRLRNNSSPHADQQRQLGTRSPSKAPMARSPGLPGTDIRHSPIMPPQGYPGGKTSTARQGDRSGPLSSLALQPNHTGFDNRSGQASPISPLSAGLPASPLSGIRPSGRRPSLQTGSSSTGMLNDSMKKTVRKFEISEPTFLTSTSRVPTMALPQSASSPDMQYDRCGRSGGDSLSQSGSTGGYVPPPLPPINPLRKRETSGPGGHALDGDRQPGPGQSFVRSRINSPPFVAGPPASRTVVTPGVNKNANMSVPGGMI
ncbi:uncharacterized protein E0L32_012218 [Thyridium curvatum]|uniref:Uncharacterized protein n=1 Tax=Thyridium curvatum TaxID=1093900 RepID=A0A507BEX0_9PEZI|nr:uncharacterized protein E0L32_012218 [Thyridium curvatum]TPX17304.1 hypothetical protein E0L32_012218 [Thyridium curvatum]